MRLGYDMVPNGIRTQIKPYHDIHRGTTIALQSGLLQRVPESDNHYRSIAFLKNRLGKELSGRTFYITVYKCIVRMYCMQACSVRMHIFPTIGITLYCANASPVDAAKLLIFFETLAFCRKDVRIYDIIKPSL